MSDGLSLNTGCGSGHCSHSIFLGFFCFVFELGPYVAQVGLNLSVWPKMDLAYQVMGMGPGSHAFQASPVPSELRPRPAVLYVLFPHSWPQLCLGGPTPHTSPSSLVVAFHIHSAEGPFCWGTSARGGQSIRHVL